jgi:3-hydroxyisobutyrate dehydrogenase-like beta-hydroxyacid dehydrogenase
MPETIGFIGLGVMGEPICRNLLRKSGRKVLAFDLAAEQLARIVADSDREGNGGAYFPVIARLVDPK